MLYNPPNVGSLPEMDIPKGTNSILYHLNASSTAPTNQWPIAVVASAKLKGGLAWVSSQLVTLEVAPRFMSGKMDVASVERGKPVKMICKLEQLVPFEGKASLSLLGLPAGTTAPDIEITKADKEAIFNVATTDKSPLGQQKGIFCSAVIALNAEKITQTLGKGGVLRIDAPKTKSSTNTNAPIAKTQKPD